MLLKLLYKASMRLLLSASLKSSLKGCLSLYLLHRGALRWLFLCTNPEQTVISNNYNIKLIPLDSLFLKTLFKNTRNAWYSDPFLLKFSIRWLLEESRTPKLLTQYICVNESIINDISCYFIDPELTLFLFLVFFGFNISPYFLFFFPYLSVFLLLQIINTPAPKLFWGQSSNSSF